MCQVTMRVLGSHDRYAVPLPDVVTVGTCCAPVSGTLNFVGAAAADSTQAMHARAASATTARRENPPLMPPSFIRVASARRRSENGDPIADHGEFRRSAAGKTEAWPRITATLQRVVRRPPSDKSSAIATIWRRYGGSAEKLADPARFELTTSAFGGQRSIQLSYGSATRTIGQAAAPDKPRAHAQAGVVVRPCLPALQPRCRSSFSPVSSGASSSSVASESFQRLRKPYIATVARISTICSSLQCSLSLAKIASSTALGTAAAATAKSSAARSRLVVAVVAGAVGGVCQAVAAAGHPARHVT